MKKLVGNLYWRICKRIGYTIVLRDYWDSKTFTLKKKNSHIALLKYIGEEDACRTIQVKQVFEIQIKKL